MVLEKLLPLNKLINLKELEKAEEELNKKISSCKTREEKLLYLDRAEQLGNKRKEIVGLTTIQKIKFNTMLKLKKKLEKKIQKQLKKQ